MYPAMQRHLCWRAPASFGLVRVLFGQGRAVWIKLHPPGAGAKQEHVDARLPRVALFTNRAVSAGEEQFKLRVLIMECETHAVHTTCKLDLGVPLYSATACHFNMQPLSGASLRLRHASRDSPRCQWSSQTSALPMRQQSLPWADILRCPSSAR